MILIITTTIPPIPAIMKCTKIVSPYAVSFWNKKEVAKVKGISPTGNMRKTLHIIGIFRSNA